MKDRQARGTAVAARASAIRAHQRASDLEEAFDDLLNGPLPDLVELVNQQTEWLAELSLRVAELQNQPAIIVNVIDGDAPEAEVTDAERIEATLRFCVETHAPVALVYHKPEESPMLRWVSPYEVRDSAKGNRLLIGYDHNREDIRQFRLDRISEVEATDEIEFHDNQEA